MKVYHGTEIWNTAPLLQGISSQFPGLYVTDTFERAAAYANARVTGIVDPLLAHNLEEGACVVELETTDEVEWRRRPPDHPTLDKCEATVKCWKVSRITLRAPGNPCIARIGDRGYMKVSDYINELRELIVLEEV